MMISSSNEPHETRLSRYIPREFCSSLLQNDSMMWAVVRISLKMNGTTSDHDYQQADPLALSCHAARTGHALASFQFRRQVLGEKEVATIADRRPAGGARPDTSAAPPRTSPRTRRAQAFWACRSPLIGAVPHATLPGRAEAEKQIAFFFIHFPSIFDENRNGWGRTMNSKSPRKNKAADHVRHAMLMDDHHAKTDASAHAHHLLQPTSKSGLRSSEGGERDNGTSFHYRYKIASPTTATEDPCAGALDQQNPATFPRPRAYDDKMNRSSMYQQCRHPARSPSTAPRARDEDHARGMALADADIYISWPISPLSVQIK